MSVVERNDSSSSSSGGYLETTISLQSCNVLNELKTCEQFTDAVIKVDNQRFPIHRVIMSTCSPYFRSLFTNDQPATNRKEIVIPGVSSDMMRIIVDYAYTRQIEVNADNVELLLPAADQFNVDGIVNACCKYLATELVAENCIGIHMFAKAYSCCNLRRTSIRFLVQNYSLVYSKSNEFLQLTADDLVDILSQDELNVKNEELVFESVLRWIYYDPERRSVCMPKLLRAIRLGLLSLKYFYEKVCLYTSIYLFLC